MNQINPSGETGGNFWYDLIKSFFITVKMKSSSSYHTVFIWNYKTYKYILAIEIDVIFMATQHRICFERLNQEFDTFFDKKTPGRFQAQYPQYHHFKE